MVSGEGAPSEFKTRRPNFNNIEISVADKLKAGRTNEAKLRDSIIEQFHRYIGRTAGDLIRDKVPEEITNNREEWFLKQHYMILNPETRETRELDSVKDKELIDTLIKAHDHAANRILESKWLDVPLL